MKEGLYMKFSKFLIFFMMIVILLPQSIFSDNSIASANTKNQLDTNTGISTKAVGKPGRKGPDGAAPGGGGRKGNGGGGGNNSKSYSQTPKYWTNTVTFKKIKVYQRNDQFKFTKSNIAKMKKGNAPIGVDKKPVNLHHMTQRNTSSIAEVTSTFHKKNSKTLHINSKKIPSGINRSQFNSWKKSYWKWRVKHR